MMQLLRKAQAGLNMTPGERAILKTLQSLFITAIITGLLAAAQYLASPGAINWTAVAYAAIIAIIFSFAHGLAKYVTASGDLPLGSAIEAVATIAEKRIPSSLQGTVQGPLVIIHQNGLTTSVEAPAAQVQPNGQGNAQSTPADALTAGVPALNTLSVTAKLPVVGH